MKWSEIQRQYPDKFILLGDISEEKISETKSRITEGKILKISDDGKEIRKAYQEYRKKGMNVIYSLPGTPHDFIIENVLFMGILTSSGKIENIDEKKEENIAPQENDEVLSSVQESKEIIPIEKETSKPSKSQKMKFLFLLLISIYCALIISYTSHNESYDDHLIRLQVKQELGGDIYESIKNEPIDIQALLLDYSDNKELVLKSIIAIMKYGDKTRKVLSLYGEEAEFKEVLIDYGEITIPIIHYFIENEITSLKVMQTVETVKEASKNLWDRIVGNKQNDTAPEQKKLDPKERGGYALNFIKKEGHNFLGQFVIDKHENVKWIQTERVLEGIKSFVAGGVSDLETKYQKGEEITNSDIFWAGTDVLAMAGTVKLLRIGKAAARSGKQVGIAIRTRAFASKILSKGKILPKIAQYSAVAATLYIVAKHPALISSILATFAQSSGLNPLIVKTLGWSFIIFWISYPLLWIVNKIMPLIVLVFNLFLSSILQMEIMLKKISPERKMI